MATDDVKKLSDDVGDLKAGFSKIADTLSELVRQRGQEAAARVERAAEDTWADAKEKFEGVKQKIHEEPVVAVGVAFGVGLLVGLLFGRR